MKRKLVMTLLVSMIAVSSLTACSVSTGTNLGKIDVYDTLKDADVTNYRDVLEDLGMDQDEASGETHKMKNGDGAYTFKIDGEKYEFTIDDYKIVSVTNESGNTIWSIDDDVESDIVDMIEALPTDVIDGSSDKTPSDVEKDKHSSSGSNDNAGASIEANDDLYGKINMIDSATGQELFAVCDYDGSVIYKFIEPKGWHVNKEYVENKYGKNSENLFFLESDNDSTQIDISNSCPIGMVYLFDEMNGDTPEASYKQYADKFEILGMTDATKYNPYGYVISQDDMSYYAIVYGSEYESFVIKVGNFEPAFKDDINSFVKFIENNF